jgi:hypothetical protein
MTNELHDLHTSLDEFAETAFADAPPSTVDIAKARSDGRRRLLATRLAPVGGGLAVVAACALVVNALGGTTAPRPAASPAPTPAPGKTKTPHPVFTTGTDPLVAKGTFGWLPDGLTETWVTAGSGHSSTDRSDQIEARHTNRNDPSGNRILSVTFSATEPPAAGGTKRSATVPGAKAAYFLTFPGTQTSPGGPLETALVWESADGTWARMDTMPYEDEATLTRVAAGITVGDRELPMPIHVEGVPKNLPIVGAASMGGPDSTGWSMGMVSAIQGGTNAGYSISVKPSQPGDKPQNLPGGNAAGSQALVYDDKCKTEAGLFICVQTSHTNGSADPLASVGGPQGLLNRITSLGPDPASWTTHVVN